MGGVAVNACYWSMVTLERLQKACLAGEQEGEVVTTMKQRPYNQP